MEGRMRIELGSGSVSLHAETEDDGLLYAALRGWVDSNSTNSDHRVDGNPVGNIDDKQKILCRNTDKLYGFELNG